MSLEWPKSDSLISSKPRREFFWSWPPAQKKNIPNITGFKRETMIEHYWVTYPGIMGFPWLEALLMIHELWSAAEVPPKCSLASNPDGQCPGLGISLWKQVLLLESKCEPNTMLTSYYHCFILSHASCQSLSVSKLLKYSNHVETSFCEKAGERVVWYIYIYIWFFSEMSFPRIGRLVHSDGGPPLIQFISDACVSSR